MPIRTTGGVFDEQVLTGSLAHYVVCGADFSGAIDQYGQPVPYSAAEIIFTNITESAYVNIMNPNEQNLSFALEAGRSTWTEISLQAMIRNLGTDVGSDHLDLSQVTVKRVPYIWGCDCADESFLDLSDTPDTYAGSENYVVTVNPTGTGLIFSPIGITSNAYAFVDVAGQGQLSATGADTLTLVAGSNITLTTNVLNNSVTINSTGSASNDYIPVPGGTALLPSSKYFVTTAGTVTLPALNGSSVIGMSVTIAKRVGITVFVNVGNGSDTIETDLGSTNSLEMDVTEELILICRDQNTWDLQIGSTP